MIERTVIEQAREIDVEALARQYGVPLTRCATNEVAGPCPCPGCTSGKDGFHVNTRRNRWRCYGCHPDRWFDAAELVKQVENCDFREAVSILLGDAATGHRKPVKWFAPAPEAPSKSWDARRSAKFLAKAQDTLWGDSALGERGRSYLESRGLDSATWLNSGLGIECVKNAERLSTPAIVIPWFVGGELISLSFRILHAGNQRYTRWGSAAGKLYGHHANLDAASTVVICEGEINAMSIWQVAHHTGVHVLSTGKEQHRLSDAAVTAIARYSTVIIWQDKPELADSIRAQIAAQSTGIVGSMVSATDQGRKLDANALLQAGELGTVLGKQRESLCASTEQLEALHSDLLGGARTLQGLDTGSAAVLHYMCKTLAKPFDLEQPEPDRWIAFF